MKKKTQKTSWRADREKAFLAFEQRCEKYFGPLLRSLGLELTQRTPDAMELYLAYSKETLQISIMFQLPSYVEVGVWNRAKGKLKGRRRSGYLDGIFARTHPEVDIHANPVVGDVFATEKAEYDFSDIPSQAKALSEYWDDVISAVS